MKRKLLSVISAFLLASALISLVGCSDRSGLLEIKPTKEEQRVVAKVGEYEVYYDELYFLTIQYKQYLEVKYGNGIWDSEEGRAAYREELNELVWGAVPHLYGALALAAEYDINPNSKAVEKYVDLQMTSYENEIKQVLYEYHSDEENYSPKADEINQEYVDQLYDNHITDRYYRFVCAVEGCVEQLVLQYIADGRLSDDETEVVAFIKNNFCRTLDVLITNDPGEDLNANRAKAEKALSLLKSGEMTFFELCGSVYNENLTNTTVNGNYFCRGEMDEEYESVAFGLEMNQYSEIVVYRGNFCIMQRRALEESYINENYETLKLQYQYAAVNSDIAAKTESLTVEKTEFGNSLDLTAIV